ncbi:hypothetical protein HOY80DRAFT_683770 [Tuber brumale]|nr:hypothetical protein HOY80DRAFT_683770 [Tuber brumale]
MRLLYTRVVVCVPYLSVLWRLPLQQSSCNSPLALAVQDASLQIGWTSNRSTTSTAFCWFSISGFSPWFAQLPAVFHLPSICRLILCRYVVPSPLLCGRVLPCPLSPSPSHDCRYRWHVDNGRHKEPLNFTPH